MTNWNKRRPKNQSLPKRTNPKPGFKHAEVRRLRVVMSICTGVPNQYSNSTGKRKAEAEADPKREKKKSREISEPLEESEPEPGKDVPVLPVCSSASCQHPP